MNTIKKYQILLPILLLSIGFYSCDKLPLQKNPGYETALYDNQLHMSVWDFMHSRQDLFSGLIRAVNYVSQFPEHQDVVDLYSQSSGNTFLLLTDNALINRDLTTSWFSQHPLLDEDPESLTYGQIVPGQDWSQYDVDDVAELLRYHVLKGTHDYTTINATPKWVDTHALSDTGKVYIFLSNDRTGSLLLNQYDSSPTLNVVPRTPDLHATNAVVQVMDTWLRQPTREDIQDN